MPWNQWSDSAALTRNVRYLIEKYGESQGIRSEKDILRFFAKAQLSTQTVRRLLRGHIPRPHQTSLDRIARALHTLVPHIKSDWLLIDNFKTFVSMVEDRAASETVGIAVPGYHERISGVRERLCGTYVSYRYSFAMGENDLVARGVLSVHANSSDTLQFMMSLSAMPHTEPDRFVGKVLPFEACSILVGVSAWQYSEARGCSLLISDDRYSSLTGCKQGFFSITARHADMSPCVARILLVRAEHEPEDLDSFMNHVTCVAKSADIITRDFGSEHERWIKAFLDNRPSGTARDMAEFEGHVLSRDSVLRVDRARFIRNMPKILEDVVRDASISAPFKRGYSWE
jgi:hypothetical protein